MLLFLGASVVRFSFLVQTAFIADADGVGVVVKGVHANLFFGTSLIDLTIALDVVVITDAFAVETGIMAVAEHIDGEALVAARGTAVNDNQVYCTHD